MIDLYTDATPNGLKISIALEELGLGYQAHAIYLGGEQMSPEFTAMNPNQKIPVIKDDEVIVTESGAILYYLAEKTGSLLPKELLKRSKVIEMLMLQMSGLGPNFGQLLVWAAAWNNEHPVATGRYLKEVKRIFTLLNTLLEGQDYFAGEYSIADIAFFPWIRMAFVHPIGEMIPVAEHKNLSAWYERINKREAVQRGLLVPEPNSPEKQMEGFVSATVGLGELHQ
jgi:GST-like protein